VRRPCFPSRTPSVVRLALLSILVAPWVLGLLSADPAVAQQRRAAVDAPAGPELVSLDFNDVELPVVIDTISRMTGFNFIYDDRVRGRVTIVSPTMVTVEQAFAVFESVLKVKGFSLVMGPGNTYKIIPIRDVKESSIDTIKDDRASPNRDRFVTRLVPLRYIDAEGITETIKPLISKEASLVAYSPTNTIIVTDSESNIRRLLSILDAIDVASYRQEFSVLKIEHADAVTLGEQLSEIYGAEVEAAAGAMTAAQRRARARARAGAATTPSASTTPGPAVRILTDERTNSLLILSSRQQLADIRELVRKLDIPVTGTGRIHVYYLRHADAEELGETLNSLLSGQQSAGGRTGAGARGPAGAAAAAQSLRSVVTPLAEGVTVTADAATNALVIQASKEAYETLLQVIERLDISRPQVLVEALIVEVDVTNSLNLGFSAAYRLVNGDTNMLFTTGAGVLTGGASSGLLAQALRSASFENPDDIDNPSAIASSNGQGNFSAAITADESNGDVNIVSAPHILTSDNEEAEIRIGNNIPIISGRTQAATGGDNLSQTVNVERQDVGVTLRVTPQISEGDTLRLQIFQELTAVTDDINAGDVDDVGVSLRSRRVENTVVVNDGETVAIGGLISEQFDDTENKVPWLGDIPFLGWLFKTKSETLRKINLLVFLTPHIVRNADDLQRESIRKRLEFEDSAGDDEVYPELTDYEDRAPRARYAAAQQLKQLSARYPIERMRAIEDRRAREREQAAIEAERAAEAGAQRYAVEVATYLDEDEATEALTMLLDAGYEGTLITREVDDRPVFTLQVGPFDDLWAADRAASLLDSAYGYSSSVTILRREEP
jgi:general secretion pathway protein D